jgi:NAD(P)-dependent dehydrogenase (short-subunit alcohol dehydrogenase family)
MNLSGKKVVITGGGGGIGRTASLLFAKYGAEVIILEYNDEAGKKTEADIIADGGKAWFIRTDISNSEAVKDAFDKIAEKYGTIDGLYNNASVFLGGKDTSIDNLENNIWDRVLAINLNGLFYCSKYASALMKEKGGAIVNTASSAGVVGIPQCAAYTATKGATVSLTRNMAADLGRYNIRTNCIAPAAIMTDMVKESNLNDPNFDNDFFIKQITPLKRWGKPEDVANLAAFLISDEGAYLNGTVIPCDGGITINGDVNKQI